MNRRSLMAVLGLAPAVAGSSVSGGLSGEVAPLAPAVASGPSTHDVMKLAYNAGLFPERMIRKAIADEHGGFRSFAHEKTIESYRSFSAVAKYRMMQEEREAQAWRRFWDGEDKTYYGLAQSARKILGME